MSATATLTGASPEWIRRNNGSTIDDFCGNAYGVELSAVALADRLASVHVMLHGLPGTGKSMLADMLVRGARCRFRDRSLRGGCPDYQPWTGAPDSRCVACQSHASTRRTFNATTAPVVYPDFTLFRVNAATVEVNTLNRYVQRASDYERVVLLIEEAQELSRNQHDKRLLVAMENANLGIIATTMAKDRLHESFVARFDLQVPLRVPARDELAPYLVQKATEWGIRGLSLERALDFAEAVKCNVRVARKVMALAAERDDRTLTYELFENL